MHYIYPVFQPPVHSFNWERGEFYLFLSGIAVFLHRVYYDLWRMEEKETYPTRTPYICFAL